ncbi:MAG: sulfotransferase domain-containing protein [Chitinophagales bacterium]
MYIVSFPKSGTTWVQVILYNLLTEGNMDFNHIYDVSPWPSNQAFNGESPEKINQMPSPRILKSHDSYDRFDEKARNKIIFVYRDGKDVAVSLYHHNKDYLDSNLTFDSNFESYFMIDKNGINYFKFMNTWFLNKNKLNILYISYEDLKSNFDSTVQKIAVFLNVDLTEPILSRVKQHSSFDFMKKNESKLEKFHLI